ncbi:hypothetical protein DXB97_02415 [Firmicutes bacterium OM07-11]|nr:hypothetical protein DXB97_02415 [Firmicutes bacterium OM07-11]
MGENKINTINLNDIFQDVKTDLIGKLLNDTKDSKTCMWYLICALDGMSDQEILELSGYTIPQIQTARNEFLMKKYQGNREVYQEVLRIKSQVNDVVQENREVRSSIEAGLDKAIQEQIEKSNRLIDAKDDMLDLLKIQLKELQGENEKLKAKVNHLENQQTERTTIVQQRMTENNVLSKSESTEKKTLQEPAESDLEVVKTEIRSSEMKEGLGKRIRKYFFSNIDLKRFIEKYLNNENLTEEQKEYMIECLESGMSLKDMDKFFSENLSVEQMKRLNSIIKNRR